MIRAHTSQLDQKPRSEMITNPHASQLDQKFIVRTLSNASQLSIQTLLSSAKSTFENNFIKRLADTMVQDLEVHLHKTTIGPLPVSRQPLCIL